MGAHRGQRPAGMISVVRSPVVVSPAAPQDSDSHGSAAESEEGAATAERGAAGCVVAMQGGEGDGFGAAGERCRGGR